MIAALGLVLLTHSYFDRESIVKRSCLLLSVLFFALNCLAQTSDPSPSLVAKTPEEMTQLLGDAFQRNALSALTGSYHLLASFETFTRDGKPDGEGSIERWATSPQRMKTISRFRGHVMTEYVADGKALYTDDGFSGSIMTYFVDEFLFHPFAPPPSSGLYRRDLQTHPMQLQGAELDCGTYQFYGEPPNSPFPTPPKEVLCVSRDTHDLILQQTLIFSIRYKEFAPFKDRSISRYVSASQGSVVRCRIHIQQLDEASLDDASFIAPADASPANPAPNWYSTSPAEAAAIHFPPVLGRIYPNGSTIHAAPVRTLVLRSRSGSVQEVEPITPMAPDLAQQAIDRAMQYKFPPLIRNGKPVETLFTVEFFITK